MIMTPEDFLKTIYLGDRACKELVIDSWERKFKLRATVISRVRDLSGQWNYYDAEDIENGCLVFEGVRELRFEPPGPLPNDLINNVSVEQAEDVDKYRFTISVSSGDESGNITEVIITVVATDCYLEDPKRPHERIL